MGKLFEWIIAKKQKKKKCAPIESFLFAESISVINPIHAFVT